MLAFVSRLGRRLARPEALGWPTFWISALVYFGTTLLFDAKRFGGSLTLWAIGWAIGQCLLIAWALFGRFLHTRLAKSARSRITLNLFMGISGGVLRALLIGFFSVGTGLAETHQWGFRLTAGAIAGLVLIIAGAGLMGAAIEHRDAMQSLEATQSQLLATRKNAPKLLEKAKLDIGNQIALTLTPRFEEITRMLKRFASSKGRVQELAEEISQVINTEVRPMSSSLAQRIDQKLLSTPKKPVRQTRRLGFPKDIDLAKALAPIVTFQIAVMLCLAFFATLTDGATTALGIAGALLLLAFLWAMARILRPLKPLNLATGTIALGLIGAASTVPISLLTQAQLGKSNALTALPLNAAFIMAVLVVGIGYTQMADYARGKFEDEMMEFNDELQRELSWIDAQLWVIRRDWSYLLHGKVQSALTAAVTRLIGSEELDEESMKLAKQDVQRAQRALSAGIGHPFDLTAALAELRESWDGLCEVEAEISIEAEKALNADTGLGRAINEILREAVGNAVRHGKAKKVLIEIAATPKTLALEVRNNGTPVVDDYTRSIGSQMMEELTLSWSLNSPSKTKTVLKATLARATSSFS